MFPQLLLVLQLLDDTLRTSPTAAGILTAAIPLIGHGIQSPIVVTRSLWCDRRYMMVVLNDGMVSDRGMIGIEPPRATPRGGLPSQRVLILTHIPMYRTYLTENFRDVVVMTKKKHAQNRTIWFLHKKSVLHLFLVRGDSPLPCSNCAPQQLSRTDRRKTSWNNLQERNPSLH